MRTKNVEYKKWYQSRTSWVGIIETTIGILGMLATWMTTQDYSAPSIVLFIPGILTFILRQITEAPIE